MLKKIPWVLGTHAFLCIVVCLVLAVFLGEFLFYHYVFLAKVQDPEAIVFPMKFSDRAYQSVVQEWKDRQGLFNSASNENYTSPFVK